MQNENMDIGPELKTTTVATKRTQIQHLIENSLQGHIGASYTFSGGNVVLKRMVHHGPRIFW
jgi:hypothetical protein